MTDTERIEELNKTAERIKNTVGHGMSVSMFIYDFLATVDLINRQKAEIQRSRADRYLLKDGKLLLLPTADTQRIRADAIKEVIARVKKEAALCCKGAFEYNPETPYGGKSEIIKEYHITEDKLKAIVKEMVGEDK